MMSHCPVTSQSWLTYLGWREAAKCPGVQTRPAGVVGVADGPPVGVFGASFGHHLVGTGCLVGHNFPLLVGILHCWGERGDWEGEHCMMRVQQLHHLRWRAVVCLCHKKVTNVISNLHIRLSKVNYMFNVTRARGLGETAVLKKQTNPNFQFYFFQFDFTFCDWNTAIHRNTKCLGHIIDYTSDTLWDCL